MKIFIIVSLFLLGGCASNQVSTNKDSLKSELSNKKVNFFLTNESSNSIPLLIPSVMNPNLSPNSSSAVTLRMGQEIYFRYKLKKYLLIKVTENINSGDKIEVSKLLEIRKKELGLK